MKKKICDKCLRPVEEYQGSFFVAGHLLHTRCEGDSRGNFKLALSLMEQESER
jgi:hypothetical protein